jgi:hypothetical protein
MADTANTLTLSRTINAGASFDAASNSYFNTEVSSAADTWQVAYDKALASGGHLATFEANAGNATAISDAVSQYGGNGFNGWLGLSKVATVLKP